MVNIDLLLAEVISLKLKLLRIPFIFSQFTQLAQLVKINELLLGFNHF